MARSDSGPGDDDPHEVDQLGGGIPADEEHLRGQGPVITPRGGRFHRNEACATLAQSQPVVCRDLCRNCGFRYPEARVVFLDGSSVVHTDPRCTRFDGHSQARCLTPCLRCS